MFKFNIDKIKINDEEINSVSSYDLWLDLEITTPFNKWVKRTLDRVEAIENIDYVKMDKKVHLSKTGQTMIDYIVSLNTAKELALVSKSSKSKLYRQSLIRIEEEYVKLLKGSLQQANKKLDNMKGKEDEYYSVKAVRHITGKYYEADKLLMYSFENKIRISSEWDVDKASTRNLYHKNVWNKVYGVKL